jgi:hypothetical protein
MSTDQQTPPRTDPREDHQEAGTDESAKKRLIDLSLTQVLAGALAAMTAAAIGSRLGAAGTIIGAAAASVVAAVAGAVYTASLRHTHEKVRTVWSGRWNSGTPGTVELVSDRADATAATARPQHTASTRPERLFSSGVRLPWKRALAGALLAFGIAAAVLTGFELISGRALSGGEGTTVTQVSKQDGGADPVKTDPDSTAREKTPAASSEPTSEPTQSAEPSTSTSTTPEQTTPTATPEPAETPPPSTRPSASAPIPSGRPSG